MTIETDIVNWARTRPTWQRAILRRVARGDHLDDKDYCGIVDKLCEAVWKGSEAFEISDFPATSPSAGQVSILAIKDIDKVNALVKGQELRFAPEGLTLAFGENGSGKSGYARLIKAMVRTRHREDILTDIFSDAGTGTATAVITLQTDGDAIDVSWPEGDRSELNQILFYDEACGDAYLTREAETTYRPHTLFVMDGLIRACDGVREELDASPGTAASVGRVPAPFLGGRIPRSPITVAPMCRVAPISLPSAHTRAKRFSPMPPSIGMSNRVAARKLGKQHRITQGR